MIMSVFAIGDIHGCFDALKAVFKAAGVLPGDTVVFLGDYVSRGPDSAKVIRWILKKQSTYRFVTLRGNHEVMMLRARKGKKHFKEWLNYGGDTILKSYNIVKELGWDERIPDAHWGFLKETAKYWQLEEFVFVHAGLKPGLALEDQKNHTLFWRKFKNPEEYAPGIQVICGHTSRKNGKIADFGHTICLDTYAYGGQWLSCLNVHSGEYWQANQKKEVRSGRLERKAEND